MEKEESITSSTTCNETSNTSILQCIKCNRILKSRAGYKNHINSCLKKNNASLATSKSVEKVVELDALKEVENNGSNQSSCHPSEFKKIKTFIWGEKSDVEFKILVEIAYEKIVYWKKNVFLLPSGKSGKKYIHETTKLIHSFTDNTPLKEITLKALMVMPALLLQKPSKKSKSKDHIEALQRRLELWGKGDIEGLLHEGETIQSQLKSTSSRKDIASISKRFVEKMSKGNINGAIKLLSDNIENGILPLNDETLQLLREKHPTPNDSLEDVLLTDTPKNIHPVRFEGIDADLIRQSALKTKGGSGPSGLDGDGWKRMLTSKSFGNEAEDLCQAIAILAKNLCSENHTASSLEPLMASRLIPLNKNPGLRPIGVGEVLRRIIGKSVAKLLRSEITDSVGSLQVCAGQDGGCEAAVHAVRRIFEKSDTEAVILVDASNAFNSVNRKVFLHNVKVICPSIATFVENCYQSMTRLFVIGGFELKSEEGTTQGDPVAMFIYAIAIIPLILQTVHFLNQINQKALTAGYADDLFGAGTLTGLREMWNFIEKEGPKYGYFQQASKTWLIVKPQHLKDAKRIFGDTSVKITAEGRKHLGAAIGSIKYKHEYSCEKIDKWMKELTTLSKIAAFAPHEAYTCFTAGYKQKLNYLMRTVSNIGDELQQLDELITTVFIPAITGGIIPNDIERDIFSLPPNMGGLGIPRFSKQSKVEFENSDKLTKQLQDNIIEQNPQNNIADHDVKKIKSQIKDSKRKANDRLFNEICKKIIDDKRKLLEISREKGASLWLSTMPIKDEGYNLDKNSFWDLIKIRYGYQLSRIPEKCVCGSNFNLQHALSCKKGGFVTQRHNTLRDVTARLLNEVCTDVRAEPLLHPLSGENFDERATITTDEARLDISARSFWSTGQTAFFDVRVFNPSAARYQKMETSKMYDINEREKKRSYGERVRVVEHGTFTPLVFSALGGMGRECHVFYKKLVELLSIKRKQPEHIIGSWVRRKISFALMKAVVVCVRGTRKIWMDDPAITSLSGDARFTESESKIN